MSESNVIDKQEYFENKQRLTRMVREVTKALLISGFSFPPPEPKFANEEEKSIYLRESAAKALGMLGDVSAVDSLVKILEAKKGCKIISPRIR